MKAKTVGKTLGDVEAEALVDTLPDTLSEVMTKTTTDTLIWCRPRYRSKQKVKLLREWRLTQLSRHGTKLKLKHWFIRRLTLLHSHYSAK